MRRFFDFLFDSEEVEVKDDYVEEKQVVKEVVPVKVESPSVISSPKVEVAQPVAVKEKPIHINLDEKVVPKEPKIVKEPKVEKKPTIKAPIADSTYQFTPLISPIFGMKEEVKVIKIENSEKLSKRNEQASLIGTILSPIYGCDNSKKANFGDELANEKVEETFCDGLFDTYDNDLEEITFENVELEEIIENTPEEYQEKRIINVENLSLFDGEF